MITRLWRLGLRRLVIPWTEGFLVAFSGIWHRVEDEMVSHEMTMRRHLADYLDGRLSLAEFTGWIAGAVWEVERYGEPDAATLGYAIELALAEKSSGLLDQHELDAELRNLALPDARRDDIDVISPQAPALRRDIA